jgi:hypothetical protein
MNKTRYFSNGKEKVLFYLFSTVKGKVAAREVGLFFKNRGYRVRVVPNSPVKSDSLHKVFTNPKVII